MAKTPIKFDDPSFTTKEAAEYLGYSVAALKKWRRNSTPDRPRFFRAPSGHCRYRKSELDRWQKKHTVKPVELQYS